MEVCGAPCQLDMRRDPESAQLQRDLCRTTALPFPPATREEAERLSISRADVGEGGAWRGWRRLEAGCGVERGLQCRACVCVVGLVVCGCVCLVCGVRGVWGRGGRG